MIVAWPGCHQRGFTYIFMETETETHSQTSDGAHKILWKRQGKDHGSHRGQKHHEKTQRANTPGLMGLTEN